MKIKINYPKYLKSNPDVILRKSKKGDLDKKQTDVLRMRVQGMTVAAIARYYGMSRDAMDIFICELIEEYIERSEGAFIN